MKRTIFSVALAILALTAATSSASAADPANCPNACPDTTCCSPCNQQPKAKKHYRHGRHNNNCRPCDTACVNLFADLGLTAEQETAIKAIPTPRQAMRDARANCTDSTACNPAEMMRTARQQYLAQVATVLTPAQYTKFLENQYIYRHVKQPRKATCPRAEQPKAKRHKARR